MQPSKEQIEAAARLVPDEVDAGNARVQEMLSWHDSGELAEFSRAGLEAWLHDLIAEVRRQAMEEAAVICDDYDNGDYAADQWHCAELLRARMEERK